MSFDLPSSLVEAKLRRLSLDQLRALLFLCGRTGAVSSLVVGKKIDDNLFIIKDLKEKPLKNEVRSNLVIIGRYILTDEIFDLLNERNENTGEIELTDGLKSLLRKEDIYAMLIEGKRFDCGNLKGYKMYLDYIKEGSK